MPFYSYACDCGHEFSTRRRVDDRAKANCPQCDALASKVDSFTGAFYVSSFQSPVRKSSDEIRAGSYHHGQGFVEQHDPNEPYRQEAQAGIEERVRHDDAIRDQARHEFDRSVDLSGPARDDARETMERDLDRQGVRR